jgi:catechol 2,3-dioxygenase-like lactoylglutathione lyase family enzyme
MEIHRGRLIDHVHIRCADLERSRTFYRAVLDAFGLSFDRDDAEAFSCDEFYADAAGGDPVTAVHLAFQAPSREVVAQFHKNAVGAGGRDNGAPGERDYHPGYYAAFVRDPDGNNIEAVYHGPGERSAASVVITTK